MLMYIVESRRCIGQDLAVDFHLGTQKNAWKRSLTNGRWSICIIHIKAEFLDFMSKLDS